MHITNRCYFDCGKNPKPPNSASCQDQDSAGSEISCMYVVLGHVDKYWLEHDGNGIKKDNEKKQS